MAQKLRVFLADDHAVVREGLKALVSAELDMEVVGEAADGRTAVEDAIRMGADVAILDISMPSLNGIQAAAQIKQRSPQMKVLTLTVHEDRGYLRRVLEAGAAGYVVKGAAPTELIDAIRAVAAGERYIDPKLAGELVSPKNRKPSGIDAILEDRLSPREEEVLRFVAQGYSNKEVAGRLNLSVKTVETYKARAIETLGLTSRVDIIRFAVGKGWLQDS